MKGQFRQDLFDEVAALVSSIGEEYITIEEGDDELQGTISVALDPSPKPILVSAEDGKDYRQFETMHLPPVDFHFRLPVGYPSKMPKVDVESIWMSTSMKENLLCRIDDVLQANMGIPVLFLCYDAIKRFVAEMGTFEIRLNSKDFSQKHNLSGLEMLKLVREESEKAEMDAFSALCHDCEVSPLTCLADKCESSASQKVIIELLGQKEFDRYEGILLKKALERMDDVVTCPRISCQKPSAISETTEYLATCLVCGYNFCTACYHGYHGVHPCFGTWGLREVSFEEYLLASQEDRLKMAEFYGGIENLEAKMEKAFKKVDARTYAWMQGHSKRCPQCNIPIQQEEEVEALVAFYGEELVKIDRSRELLEGSVSIELEPKTNPILLYVDSEEGRQSFNTKQLSPIGLVFRFPVDYPTTPIDLSLQSLWSTANLAEEIHDHLEVLAKNTSDPCFLLRCCDAVKNFIEKCDLKEICLDGNPYSTQNVCYDNKSGPECVKFNPCGHVFCKECVRTYFLDQLTAMRVAPLSCLSPRCESYPSEMLIEELVGEDHFERYQRIILSNVLARIDDIAFCPRPRCQSPAPRRSCTSLLAICPVCDYSFCIKCHRAYHGVNPCRATVVAGSRMVEDEEGNLVFKEITVDEYLAATDDQRQEMAWWYGGVDKLEEVMDKALGLSEKRSQKFLEKYTRTCPTCGVAIMVEEGCNEVFCRCGTSFCFGCGELLMGEEGGSGIRTCKSFLKCQRVGSEALDEHTGAYDYVRISWLLIFEQLFKLIIMSTHGGKIDMLRNFLLLFLHVLILVNGRSAQEEAACSNFGLNWSAEIRCLRAELSQCKRFVKGRGIRTADHYGYSKNYIEFSTPPPPPIDNNYTITLEVSAPGQPGLEKTLADLTRQLNEKLNQIRERIEDDYKRKFDSFQKRLDLFTARVHKRGPYEYAYMKSYLSQLGNSWYKAEDDCLAWGGHLTSISDMKENEFVRSLLQGGSAWIGVNDVQRENIFVNTDRTPVVFKNFKRGQPDNGGHDENCVEMLSSGEWTDVYCLATKPFVCKR
ncbi:unnamed protein product [Haemonchus placei]|uniref:RBR-type E3 ubiquitin transferase n=1 Tax=Haemonchus placei TaxID=6290 RepID=A0A158QMG9_HAEPC|nr:unnamed protein product [Haemonchus placei]